MKNKLILSLCFFSLCIMACGAQISTSKKEAPLTKTTTMTTSSYSKTSSYVSTLTEQAHTKILVIVTDLLKAPDVEKGNSKIWFFVNENERFEVNLHADEIAIEFKSNIQDSDMERMINATIDKINQVIDTENQN